MSNTIVHRPHVHHIPLTPVIVVIAIVMIAAAVLWAVSQPEPTTTTTVGASIVSPVVHPAAVAAPESPVFRHTLMRVNAADGYPRAYVVGRLHQVDGATLDPVGTNPYGTASYTEPVVPR